MKKFIFILILILAINGIVSAQTPPTPPPLRDVIKDNLPENLISWESPTSAATNGLFTSDADDFISPSFYSGVEFEKFYALTSFADSRRVNFGFATKIKSLYIGAYYGGKFIADKIDHPYKEQTTSWLGKKTNGVRVYEFDTQDDFLKSYDSSDLDNEFSLLIGAANMGFRFSFASTYQSFEDNDFIFIVDPNGTPITNYVKNAQFGYGDITPQIAWGMAKDLTDNGIRPYASFQLGFHNEYGKYQLYTGTSDKKLQDEEVLKSMNYVAPIFALGLGGFTFLTRGEFELSADFDYAFTIISSGDNEYNYKDDKGKQQIKTFSGFNRDGELAQLSLNYHSIAPSLYGSWTKDNFSFMLRLGLDFEVTNITFTGMEEDGRYDDGTLAKDGEDGNATVFSFIPSLGLAAQWQVASKLALNLGGYLTPGTVTRETTETLEYSQGEASDDGSVKTVSTSYKGARSLLTFGAVLNATKNLTFEAVTGAGYSSKEKDPDDNKKDKNSVSVFGKDDESYGLLYFFQLLVSVKF